MEFTLTKLVVLLNDENSSRVALGNLGKIDSLQFTDHLTDTLDVVHNVMNNVQCGALAAMSGVRTFLLSSDAKITI